MFFLAFRDEYLLRHSHCPIPNTGTTLKSDYVTVYSKQSIERKETKEKQEAES